MLSEKQKEIVLTDEKEVVVLSAAASGKTRVLTERARYLLKNKLVDPKGMVIITFTNAAAEEMRERLGEDAKDVYVGTIHGYANYLLLAGGINTSHLIDNEEFDEFFELIKKHPEVVKSVDYLLLDEAQDSSDEQFDFIIEMIQPKGYMLFGDLRQSIYGFRGANPESFFELSQASGVTTYDLNENYRNGANILTYAKGFLRNLGYLLKDTSVARAPYEGKVVSALWGEQVTHLIQNLPEYKDWFVLTRTNAEAVLCINTLEKAGIPCSTFKKAQLSTSELNEKLKENSVKVLTIHTAKGLENEYVAVLGARTHSPEERRISYVAATRAKKLLVWCKKKPQKKAHMVDWS